MRNTASSNRLFLALSIPLARSPSPTTNSRSGIA